MNHESQYSALANHYQSGHSVSFDSAKIIHSEQNLKKRIIAEALIIRDKSIFSGNTPSFNVQIFGYKSKLENLLSILKLRIIFS